MFQAVPPPIIRSSKTVYTASGILSNHYYYLPLSMTVAGSIKGFDKIPDAVYAVFELLMMGGGTA